MTKPADSERSLFESERAFRLLVQGVVDYAICMLGPTGIVVSWNAGAGRIKATASKRLSDGIFPFFIRRKAVRPCRADRSKRRDRGSL